MGGRPPQKKDDGNGTETPLPPGELNDLRHIRQSPADEGTLLLISRRPQIGERELLREGKLDVDEGLAGGQLADPGRTRDNLRATPTRMRR